MPPITRFRITRYFCGTHLPCYRSFDCNVIKELREQNDANKKVFSRIIGEIKTAKNADTNRNSTRISVLPPKPYENLIDFQKFESSLQDNEILFNNLVSQLTADVAGLNSEFFLKSCWRKIINDEVAKQLCWKGTGSKLAVRALNVTAAIKTSVSSKFPSASATEFEKVTIAFFQHAKGRLR